MKQHGRVEADGKRYANVWVDPDGGFILASRITGRGETKLREGAEYRLERYEVDELGNIIGELPKPSVLHQQIRADVRAKRAGQGLPGNPPTPPLDQALPGTKSRGQGGSGR